MRRAFLVVPCALVLSACDQKIPESGNVPLSASVAAEGLLTGTVLEVIPAAPYVYLKLKTDKGEVWAAVDGAPVQTGTKVSIANAIMMKEFQSASLKRTFPEVYFGSLADGNAAAAPANPHTGTAPATLPVDVGMVAKATGANAYTVAETWARRERLDGVTITIRGVVTKVNEGVMGKNWLHLQDGSGDAEKGVVDITVTSKELAKVGDTITVTGTVRINRDLGAGYVYPVLVEDARIAFK